VTIGRAGCHEGGLVGEERAAERSLIMVVEVWVLPEVTDRITEASSTTAWSLPSMTGPRWWLT
jgi:hypothetical protein